MRIVSESVRDVRTAEDRKLDSVLLLYMLERVRPCLGRLKVQKTAFLVEHDLQSKGIVGPHFKFFRYFNGPFSTNLWDDFDELSERGLVDDAGFEPTDRGRFLLDLIIPELREISENQNTLQRIDTVLEWCKPRSGATLMEHAYDLEVNVRPGTKIRNIPYHVDLIQPPSGGWVIPPDLADLISEELAITQEEADAELVRLPETMDEATMRLAEAMLDPDRS